MLLVADASPREVVNQDSVSYLGSAAAIQETGNFTLSPDTDEPMFFRTPGYPLFLAVIRSAVGSSVKTLAAFQALLSVLIALGVFAVARWWWGGWTVPLVAAAAAAFEPLQLWTATQIGTESLAAAAYVAVVLAATWASRRAAAWAWAVVGLLVALATFVRPTTYYFPIVLAVALVVGLRFWDRWPGWRRSVLWAFAVLVPCVLCFGAWQARNDRAVSSWRFSAVEGINMYQYRAAGVVADITGRPFGQVRQEFQVDFLRRHAYARQGPAIDAMFDEGREIVMRHPLAFVRVTVRGAISLVWSRRGPPSMIGLGTSSSIDAFAVFGLAAFYGVMALGVARVLRTLRRSDVAPAHVVALLLVAYVVLVSSGPEGTSRLRAPLTPLLALYFAYGIDPLVKGLAATLHRSAPVPPTTSPASTPVPASSSPSPSREERPRVETGHASRRR